MSIGLEIIGVSTLKELLDYLKGKINLEPEKFINYDYVKNEQTYSIDFEEVKGQSATKRALEIAVARKSQRAHDRKPRLRQNHDGKKNRNYPPRPKL